ncbi:aminodeoxychorismate synthase, component I [Paenibacillus baekrokdamisoli]|uniref:Aminodeoxychorismate synthase, component I n=1 Tax=Paenibacillus baekrokdamisoli TaxID=1712516 RepID=A0A3G9JGY2_9BACL|nr:anthranilate synthase component I family protein [Paenibacillus baekrokdamisoli]MBB3073016.1 para-aminobenzoate synthetase component 1 [Paenibacillus baekrokdamisoli]BBH23318.1 aminodeoxychorismate synthase, component I [Paenibacillus baekrokdamisoli]
MLLGAVKSGGLDLNITAFKEWLTWQENGYHSLPVLYKRPLESGEDRPSSWESAWKVASPHSFVLESGKDGRYTYLGLHPASVIRGKGTIAEAVDSSDGRITTYEEQPLEAVRIWMSSYNAPRLQQAPKWTGGCVGFWGYDVIRSIERIPEHASDDLGLPDYLFLRVDELWIIDHKEQMLYCAVHSKIDQGWTSEQLLRQYEQASDKAERMSQLWTDLTSGTVGNEADALRQARMNFMEKRSLHIDVEAVNGIFSPFSKDAYQSAVERIKCYISQGDVFQVNLSTRQSRNSTSSPEELYEWLRLVNPSPYMGFLRCPDFQLVSGSPELLVELQAGKLATRPIAGTRRRGLTEEEDRLMAEELLGNEKERAEHIMLVDLERNDLGRISAYGTVRVEELMVIEYYSHVMHLVSQVEGKLAADKDAYDVIAATFPGGTITGAPKIRTMEIIEELEPVRRGPYTGSLGWIDYNGDMEFNIIIRTMTVKDNTVHIQAGAGIVIDSDPEREYYESLSKAKALWKSIQYSEQWAEAQR